MQSTLRQTGRNHRLVLESLEDRRMLSLTNPHDFQALGGDEAADFVVSEDMRLVTSFHMNSYGLTYERYQQTLGAADVLGGQITVFRNQANNVTAVIGARYADIEPANVMALSSDDAQRVANHDIGAAGKRNVDLLVDPHTGLLFYQVETQRDDSRWFHRIDAQDGQVLRKYDAMAAAIGYGVAYDDGDATDVKDLTGLTTFNGSEYELRSADGRQETHDAKNKPKKGPIATDTDDDWVIPGDDSPAQPALVDVQYYANVFDDYLLSTHSFDWVAQANATVGLTKMDLHAHFRNNWSNAQWTGSYARFGDGDQIERRELTSLDVVAHELTHGLIDFTSNLGHTDEPGALNESLSDIMGTVAEFYADANGLEPAVTRGPDWTFGEDYDLTGDTVPGGRNLADPEEDEKPDHYSERQIGGLDSGGVHTNSSISNHAFYLLVNGGLNASCASPADHNSAHCTGNETPVTGIGLSHSEAIFFLGFAALTTESVMADARSATEAMAVSLFGAGSPQALSTTAAWMAVGVGPAGNTNPVANDDSVSTNKDTSVIINVLANDMDGDGDTLMVTSATDPLNGSLIINVDDTVTYTPDLGFTGIDDFEYDISDGNGGNDTAMVTVSVTELGMTMHVGDLDAQSTNNGSTWTAGVTIAVHDDGESAIAGATVLGTWSGGGSGSASCVTDGAGQCSVSLAGIPKKNGSVLFTVDDVTGTLNYETADNHDVDGDSDGTSITVNKSLQVLGATPTETFVGRALTEEVVRPAVEEALAHWAAAGVSPERLAPLARFEIEIEDLAGSALGLAYSDWVVLDRDAAGHGWSFDSGGVDLVSVLMHEFGHVLGFDHEHHHPVMRPALPPGGQPSPLVLSAWAIDILFSDHTISRRPFGSAAVNLSRTQQGDHNNFFMQPTPLAADAGLIIDPSIVFDQHQNVDSFSSVWPQRRDRVGVASARSAQVTEQLLEQQTLEDVEGRFPWSILRRAH